MTRAREGRVERAETSKLELDEIRRLVAQNMTDAAVPGISDDLRFGVAYSAARLLAVMSIRASGFRVRLHGGGHLNTFLALRDVEEPAISSLAPYLDACREKRNHALYVRAEEVSRDEVEELLREVVCFRETVERWLASRFPHLK